MKEIPLTKGLVAIVDDEDYEELSKYKWQSVKGYAYRVLLVSDGKGRQRIGMHRQIMGLDLSDERVVDHIDRNPINNKRSNLRICTEAENAMNRSMLSANKSGYKGVSWEKNLKKWRAQIQVNGKNFALGVYSTPEEAHAAYCIKAVELHGEFANAEIKKAAEALSGREPHKPRRNRTGLKGIQYSVESRKWRAKIIRNGVLRYLGYFDTPEAAHEAYCQAAREMPSMQGRKLNRDELSKAA